MGVLACQAPSTTLSKRAYEAFSVSLLASILKLVLALATQAIIARILGPHEYGLFAVVLLLFGVTVYFADTGVTTSLIQRQAIDSRTIRQIWSLNLISSISVAGLFYVCAPVLAAYLDKDEATSLLRIMAPILVVQSAASLSLALLRRSLDYSSIQRAQLAGYFFGFSVCGIGLSYFMQGATALVIAFALQAIVTWLLLYERTRHSVVPSFSIEGLREHITIAKTVLITNLVNWGSSSADRAVVAHYFPASSVGHYTAANGLLQAPAAALYPQLQSVTFSLASRLQTDPQGLRRLFKNSFHVTALLGVTLFGSISLVASDLVLTVYGESFRSAAAIAQPLAVLAPSLLLWGILTPFLWNTGRRDDEYRLQLPFLLLSFPSMAFASIHSLTAVAWTAALISLTRILVLLRRVLAALDLSWRDLLSTVRQVATVSSLAAMLTLLSLHVVPYGSPLLRGSVGSLIPILTLGLGVILYPRLLPYDVRSRIAVTIGRRWPSWDSRFSRFR